MIVLGHYKEIYKNNSYPSINNDINKNIENKDKILSYMKGCKVTSASPTILTDVISGKRMPFPLTCMTDGKYAWRSDLIYYVENYNLLLPSDFVDHALKLS